MRILFLNQFFHPDLAASAQMVSDLAFDLAAAGHDVTVVCGRGVYAGADRRRPMRERIRGVDIRRLPCTNFGRGSLAGRLADYATFLGALFCSVPLLPRNDVFVTMSTPPLLPVAGLAARALGKGKVVDWVQDVYPDIALELGVLRPGLLADMIRAVSGFVLRHSDRIVVIGEVMAERLVAAGADPLRIRIVENWADGEGLRRQPEGSGELRKTLGFEGKFVVLYSGNLGNAHDFSGLAEAIPRVVAAKPNVRFAFVGEGAQKRKLVEAFAPLGEAVRFLPYVERDQLSDSLALGDLHLVTQKIGLEGLVVPSKFYGILAAGRPMLFLGPERTEVAARIRKHDVGTVVDPRDGEAVAKGIGEWVDRATEERREVGERARRVFERDYDKGLATGRFVEAVGGMGR